MGYKQLTEEERYQIYGHLTAGITLTGIANLMGVHKSTVSREVRRNMGQKGYRPKQANLMAQLRKAMAYKAIKMVPPLVEIIEEKIREDWSPEQISGRLFKEEGIAISHERIYQHIKRDKDNGGILHKHLRQGHKKRKKRFGSVDRRGQIKNRRSIDNRPAIVDKKSRVGDFERDLIIGRNNKQAILTIVDRASKITLAQKVETKSSEKVGKATLSLLRPISAFIETITNDNGKEFADHEVVESALGKPIYFCHPYSSFERGINENTNGLLRQYFPKKSSFKSVTNEDIQIAVNKLNNRPRKILNYATPYEIFCGKYKLNELLHL